MITILLIEDNLKDAEVITSLLKTSLADKFDYTLIHKADTKSTLSYLENTSPSLILMDLEIKDENQTTLGIIERIPDNIPIIVISHLSHYQKPSLRHGNVLDFVPKSSLKNRLSERVIQILSPQNEKEPKHITFPSVNKTDISETVPIYKISYIYLIGRGRYEIHFSDRRVLALRSILFKDLLRALKEQQVTSLQPISRNEIININYISKIKKNPSGRIELSLIGNEDYLFHVGKDYEKYFEDMFL